MLLLLLLSVVELLLHLELLGLLLGLHHPHLRVLRLLLRHAASTDALAHGRRLHHTPTGAHSTGPTHAVEAAGPSPLGAGERILPLAEGQVLLPGGLLLVGDEALDDPAVGGAAGSHSGRAQAGPTAGSTPGATGGTTGRRRMGRDAVMKVRGRLGHHPGGGNAIVAVAVGGPTTTTTTSATATAAWHARSHHGLELSDPIVPLLDLGLQLGDLYDMGYASKKAK